LLFAQLEIKSPGLVSFEGLRAVPSHRRETLKSDCRTQCAGYRGKCRQKYNEIGEVRVRGLWGDSRGIARGLWGIARGLRGYCMDADKSCKFAVRLAVPVSVLFILLSCYYYYH